MRHNGVSGGVTAKPPIVVERGREFYAQVLRCFSSLLHKRIYLGLRFSYGSDAAVTRSKLEERVPRIAARNIVKAER